jgi:hypothetical protein
MPVRKIVAALLGLMGLAYFLQGIGVLTAFPSFMVNDIRWAGIGALTVAAALWLWGRN